MDKRKAAKWIVLGGIALFVLIQFVPYGRNHTNPPVKQAAQWTSPAALEMATASCYDCHSNLTDWRWYSNIAPTSWLVYQDVQGGRENLNFSDWAAAQPDVDELVEVVEGGTMPPLKYTIPHPSAKLSSAEKQKLVAYIRALYKTDPPPIKQGGGG